MVLLLKIVLDTTLIIDISFLIKLDYMINGSSQSGMDIIILGFILNSTKLI
nr:MAG TPA: hypothetical protein [Bacteriophage sp.]